jgi:hypothetical protein
MSLERLEKRQLLSYADFELSSLLPANGGDGSKGFVIDGIVAAERLGNPRFTYESVGDVNGDQIDDLLVAAPGVGNGGGTGTPTASDAYIVFGRSEGFPAALDLHSLDGTTGYVIHDAVLGDDIGFVGGGAGDLNHDGSPDLVLGALYATPSPDRVRAGQTFVIFGGGHLALLDAADGTQDGQIDLSWLDGAHGFVINGAQAGDVAGRSVGTGDVNGDHIDDLLIGANRGANPGRAYVVFGRDSTFPAALELSSLDGSNGFVIQALQTGGTASFGNVGKAGDINGDGIGDLVIGHWTATPSSNRLKAGQAYVIFGRTSFPASFNLSSLNGSNGFIVNGAAPSDFLGYQVDGVGDINDDGIDDVAFGATHVMSSSGVQIGAAYVVFGKTTSFPADIEVNTLTGGNGFAIYGVANSDAGAPLGRAGDVNGDSLSDLVVAAPSADLNGVIDAGQSYVIYGRRNFGANLDLGSLLAANGGDGSAGFAINGFLTGQNTRPTGIGDINNDGFDDIRVGAEADDPNGLTDAGRAYIIYGGPSPAPVTRFYAVNDASRDRTYEYSATGTPVEDYALNSGNTLPRGAAATAAGDKVWVVDSNKYVYVYSASGGLLGSWTAGSLASNATVEGIATNGTDIWIVDDRQDKVFKYTGAASRLSGSQNAAGSFGLNSGNTSPKDVVTDGTNLWVVNDSTTDKVFEYNLSGTLLGSWTISGAGSSPTGITLNPSNVANLWIVDSGSRRVYQFDNAAGRTSGSQSPSTSFALAAGNTNPQGIADPPVGDPLPVLTPRRSAALAQSGGALRGRFDFASTRGADLITVVPSELAQGVGFSYHGRAVGSQARTNDVRQPSGARPRVSRLAVGDVRSPEHIALLALESDPTLVWSSDSPTPAGPRALRPRLTTVPRRP